MIRRLKVCSIVLAVFLLCSANSYAVPIIISDNYVGGNPTGTSWDGKDVIGNVGDFGVSSMSVDFIGSSISIKISSGYFDSSYGTYGTKLGDLFISTDGWKPYGSAPYQNDYGTRGEDWEYALKLSGTPTAQGTSSAEGQANLYAVSDGQILDTNYFFDNTNYIFREGQEAQFNPNADAQALNGSPLNWEYGNGVLSLMLPNIWSGLATDFGFHWTMTCGNDVIEGGVTAPVPEPATLLLLGTGLLGLAGLNRRKLLK